MTGAPYPNMWVLKMSTSRLEPLKKAPTRLQARANGLSLQLPSSFQLETGTMRKR